MDGKDPGVIYPASLLFALKFGNFLPNVSSGCMTLGNGISDVHYTPRVNIIRVQMSTSRSRSPVAFSEETLVFYQLNVSYQSRNVPSLVLSAVGSLYRAKVFFTWDTNVPSTIEIR
ncbi:uncharacterized protein M421DRAFT_415529 [Didymella exigua CBS 183.55]|uniref:Uncharacterized protein n=1 Tax=Didymella exigua CBS 183.55 TaxID=1150837 RepID=A0A6A5RXF4_9PLEO|nr:uncharacterized protein M421DRAFT_415529 [Didymella exigua CBS 183.55]KAF1933165.1 hypothetical protein M421DRAFT_415529 [Didymella exigua CBS 183.55]